jgi:hypothetical protein
MQALKIFTLFAVVSAFLAFLGYRMMTETQPTPCSPDGSVARCYNISEHLCTLIWEKSEAACKAYVDKQKFPPGRLVGPIMLRCQALKVDEAFSASRKSNPECEQMHRDLEDWKKRNDVVTEP